MSNIEQLIKKDKERRKLGIILASLTSLKLTRDELYLFVSLISIPIFFLIMSLVISSDETFVKILEVALKH